METRVTYSFQGCSILSDKLENHGFVPRQDEAIIINKKIYYVVQVTYALNDGDVPVIHISLTDKKV